MVLAENESLKRVKEEKPKKSSPPPSPKKVNLVFAVFFSHIEHFLRKIFEFLNKYIIGQDHAKRVMSVAVYNHYKRLHNNLIMNKAKKSNSEDGIVIRSQIQGKGNLDSMNFNYSPSSMRNTQFLGDRNGQAEIIRKGTEVLQTEEYDLKLDKSNILMLGPTGSGKRKRYIFCF